METQRIRKAKLPLSSGDWEPFRAVIESLYLKQDMSLSKVVQVMKENYGFIAR